MRSDLNMEIGDLAKWFVNFRERSRVAEQLPCTKEEGLLSWGCCVVHHGLSNEWARMHCIANRLVPKKMEYDVFSPRWWEEAGQTEVATMLMSAYMVQS